VLLVQLLLQVPLEQAPLVLVQLVLPVQLL
jgi:hypothetical protein